MVNGGRFKMETCHTVSQQVTHPSLLFFNVYLTYKSFLDLIKLILIFEAFRSLKTKLDFLEFFLSHSLPKSYSGYCKTELYESVYHGSTVFYPLIFICWDHRNVIKVVASCSLLLTTILEMFLRIVCLRVFCGTAG